MTKRGSSTLSSSSVLPVASRIETVPPKGIHVLAAARRHFAAEILMAFGDDEAREDVQTALLNSEVVVARLEIDAPLTTRSRRRAKP